MGKLDIKFLWWIESQKHWTSLGWSCQLYTYTVGDKVMQVLLDIGSFVWMPDSLAPNHLDNIDLEKLDAIVLTHVHNDHVWKLAEIVKAWYRNPIYMTPLSAKFIDPILDDALKIQRSQITAIRDHNKRLWKKLQLAHSSITDDRKKEKLTDRTIKQYQNLLKKYKIEKNSDIKNALLPIPLWTTFDEHDILQTIIQIQPIEYEQEFDFIKGWWSAKFLQAGHVPWAAQVMMDLNWKKYKTEKYRYKLVNTWDLGRFHDNVLLDKPKIPLEKVDLTIIEWTYGGRNHPSRQNEMDNFIYELKNAQDMFVLPAFSLQRFQEIMLALWSSIESGSLNLKKEEKIFCVSPLAYKFCKILMAQDPVKYWFLAKSLFYWIQTKEDEQVVANIKWRRKIIIAWGGMVQWWSSVKYVQQAMQNPKAHIKLTWYQATGTLGKEILDKYGTNEYVQLSDRLAPIRATVWQLKSFSSHADEKDLVHYASKIDPRASHQLIITHGGEQRFDLKQAMQTENIRTTYIIPDIYDTISIDTVTKKNITNK